MVSVISKILIAHQPARRFMQILLWMGFPFILCSCAANTTVRQHPECKVRFAAAKTAMLVPPESEVVFKSSQGSTKLPEEAAKAAKDLSALVAAELSQRGFQVKSGEIQVSSVDNMDDNPAHATAVKGMYDRLALEMYGSYTMPESQALAYRYTLGPEAAELAKQAEAGSLVFVRLRMWKRSGGDNAAETGKNLLIGMATLGMVVPPKNPSGAAVLQVVLVDGSTGDVLWGNQISEVSFTLVGKPNFLDDLKEMVADLFKPFPQ